MSTAGPTLGKLIKRTHCILRRQFVISLLFVLTVAERPQHMLMRVAVGIHENDIDEAIVVSLC